MDLKHATLRVREFTGNDAVLFFDIPLDLREDEGELRDMPELQHWRKELAFHPTRLRLRRLYPSEVLRKPAMLL